MEIAYVSSNRLDLEIEKNKSGLIPKILSIITQNPSRFIATMLIGNNFVLVIYGIFMGQFIMDNIPFVLLDSLNEFIFSIAYSDFNFNFSYSYSC